MFFVVVVGVIFMMLCVRIKFMTNILFGNGFEFSRLRTPFLGILQAPLFFSSSSQDNYCNNVKTNTQRFKKRKQKYVFKLLLGGVHMGMFLKHIFLFRGGRKDKIS